MRFLKKPDSPAFLLTPDPLLQPPLVLTAVPYGLWSLDAIANTGVPLSASSQGTALVCG